MTDQPLKKEFEYFLAHQADLVRQYNGKFIVIKDQAVIGIYDTQEVAFSEASKNNEVGSFLIQECKPGNESYTQTFHTRVVI